MELDRLLTIHGKYGNTELMRNGCLWDDQRRETVISKRKSISQLHAVKETEENSVLGGKKQKRGEDKMADTILGCDKSEKKIKWQKLKHVEIDISNMMRTQYYRMGQLIQSRVIGFNSLMSE